MTDAQSSMRAVSGGDRKSYAKPDLKKGPLLGSVAAGKISFKKPL